MSENKSIVFISDIHLSPACPDRTRKFISFLNSRKNNTDAIYILGDLFDFWIGADHLKLEEHRGVIKTLYGLHKCGVSLFFIKGNRDFYADRKLEKQSGMKILGEHHAIELGEKKIFLTHGDTLAAADRLYPAFRRLSRSKLCTGFFACLPPKLKYGLAFRARKTSMEINSGREKCGIIKNKAASIFRKGFDVIICGHIHRASKFKLEAGGSTHTVYTLGDWDNKGTFLIYADGIFRTDVF